MSTYLDGRRAFAMWEDGADTLQIAKAMNCAEAEIYNRLPKWRLYYSEAFQIKAAEARHITTRTKNRVPPVKEGDYRMLKRKGFRAREASRMLGIA